MDILSLALSKKFTKDTADEFGAVKGAPCTVGGTSTDENGNTVVKLVWTNSAGKQQTTSVTIQKGPKGDRGLQGGNGISVKSCYINEDGKVVFVLADETELDPVELPSTDVKLSEAEGNILEKKEDGLFAKATDIDEKLAKKQDKIIEVTSAEYQEKVASGEITKETTDYYSVVDDQEDEKEYKLNLYSIMDRTVMNGSSDNFYITKKGNKGYLHLRGTVGCEPSASPTPNMLVTVPEGWRPKHTFLNLLLTGWDNTSPHVRLARVAFFDDGRIKIRESDIPKSNTNSTELDFEYEIKEE